MEEEEDGRRVMRGGKKGGGSLPLVEMQPSITDTRTQTVCDIKVELGC